MMLMPLCSTEAFDALIAATTPFWIYKHSTRCEICSVARDEVETYAALAGHAPVYLVDVLADRPLSQRIAAQCGRPHQSPQVLRIAAGALRFAASHYAITAAAMQAADTADAARAADATGAKAGA